jgi:hypothetical protein
VRFQYIPDGDDDDDQYAGEVREEEEWIRMDEEEGCS